MSLSAPWPRRKAHTGRRAYLRAKKGETQPALELLLIILDHPACDQETRHRATHLQREWEPQRTSRQLEAVRLSAQRESFEPVVEEILGQVG